ncbi:MAG: DinB family protein [Chloroflexi bacterium]|nr:DinB family protein [Chloroflexota bacterium]
MNIRDILTLYDYHYWANQRILAAAAQSGQEQFLARAGHSLGSLRALLAHCVDAEYGWRTLWQTGTVAGFETVTEEQFPTLDALARRWAQEEMAMRAYLAGLTDADLSSYVRYTTDEGAKRERLLWHCLWHLVNHGTQHRSEVAAILTGYGYSPGDLDFTVFLNERPR